LARNLVPISVPKGSAVITQGETGDRFYAILEGTVEVLVDGRPSRRSAREDRSARSR